MGVQPQATAKVNEYSYVPPTVAAAATRYQTFRVIEAEHLALMARHDLSKDWTPEIRQIVFNAGDHVRQARDARQLFRAEVREFVVALRSAHEPLSAVLRHTRTMLQLLENAGALKEDGGWLEAEVLEWAIEEYENVA
jgi:hypothetical protein